MPPFFHAKFFAGTAENCKKHYVLNGFAEKIVFQILDRLPKNPSKDLMRTKSTLFCAPPIELETPLKQARNAPRGIRTPRGDRIPLFRPLFLARIPLLQQIDIYIYTHIKITLPLHLFLSPPLAHCPCHVVREAACASEKWGFIIKQSAWIWFIERVVGQLHFYILS